MGIRHITLRPFMRSFARTCAVALASAAMLGGFTPHQAQAQNQFATAIKVNDRSITNFEIEERIRFLRLLRAPGEHNSLAREQLIDDRLKIGAAAAVGIMPSSENILAGMEEFAARANLTREEFVKTIEAGGVSEQAFRDFVTSGIAWRQLIQARFGGRVDVSEDEVDRALASTTATGGVRVLLSEIIMPAPPAEAAAVQERAERIAQIKTTAAFGSEARRYSASPSRARSGRLDWLPISQLPAQLRPIILGLAPGEVSAPIPLPNAIALFQLRDIEETDAPDPKFSAIEYAAYYIAGGRTEAALASARKIENSVDRCDDLYGVAKGQDPSVLDRGAKIPSEIPADIALELAKLDPGEISTALTRSNGQTLVLLMLCGRTPDLEQDVDRAELSLGLRNQRLESYSNGYLEQLRADARITEK
ncbi:peptidylprolyl isomerase [Planktotalea arctica]|uniref:peptidylprolyl isomerase n=1 Tax=Planktotalea arctica TaxID=1481893 RepID=UPI00321A0A23